MPGAVQTVAPKAAERPAGKSRLSRTPFALVIGNLA